MRTVIAICGLAIVCSDLGRAAPYGPEGMTINFTQPDGAELTLKVFGDEFYARTETPDGYTVVHDPAANAYFYARLSADRKSLESTGVLVGGSSARRPLSLVRHLEIDEQARIERSAAARQLWEAEMGISERWEQLKEEARAREQQLKTKSALPAAAPSVTKVGLTLLVDFSDEPATIPQSEVQAYCNGDDYTGYGNAGSVKKYFLDNSGGRLIYSNVVTAYVRLPKPKSYYNDNTRDFGAMANELIRDAVIALKERADYQTVFVPQLEALTVDGANRILACNVFYAGILNNGVWTKGLWPHSWALYQVGEQTVTPSGRKIWNYQITDITADLKLGTFCHENGHLLLGFPDLYDSDYSSKGGAAGFCLMAYGGYAKNPGFISAYLRMKAGWTEVIDITGNSALTAELVAPQSIYGFNRIYRYTKPGTPTEYFLLENRQKSGRDAELPASGIAVWHIDERGSNNNESLEPNTFNSNYQVTLVQADNRWDFQNNRNSGDENDLYYAGNAAASYSNRLNDASSPSAKWWDGSDSGLKLRNFSRPGAVMTVRVGPDLATNTVSLVAPVEGVRFSAGQTVDVAWDANTSGSVKLELVKGGVLSAVVATNESNDGFYRWTIPANTVPATDYAIRVSSSSAPAVAATGGSFAIFAPQPDITVELTKGSDFSGNAAYSSGNFIGLNGGFGFGSWVSAALGKGRAYLGQTSVSARSFAIYAGDWTGNSYRATRPLAAPLGVGESISVQLGHTGVGAAGAIGVRLYAGGSFRFGLKFLGGLQDWLLNDGAFDFGTGLPWQGGTPLNLVFTREAGNNYSVRLTSGAFVYDGFNYSGNAGEMSIDRVEFYSEAQAQNEHLGFDFLNRGDSLAQGDGTAFGSLTVGTGLSTAIYTVRNDGQSSLNGLSITKEGLHTGDFSVGALGKTQLAPGESTTFTVAFAPSASGRRSAALRVQSNDPDETSLSILLSGAGVSTVSGFGDWIAGFPALADKAAGGDPDGDGLPNLVEYFTGGDPSSPATEYPMSCTISNGMLQLDYVRSKSAAGVTGFAEWSGNVAAAEGWRSDGVQDALLSEDANHEFRRASVAIVNGEIAKFLRLQVSEL